MEQSNLSSLRTLAHYYYSMGFNVTCISNIENDYNYFNASLLKAPTHKWEHLITRKQTLEELTSYEWESATGIGCVNGYNNIRCIDIDGVRDFGIIEEILQTLNLPSDYEWVFLTGSGSGIHIYINTEQHHFVINNGQTKGFYPSRHFKDKFKILELRWKYHCVLPPSLHKSYNYYKFHNGIPKNPRKAVSLWRVEYSINYFCDHDFEVKSHDSSPIYFLNTKV